MKTLRFLGDSRNRLCEFSPSAKQNAGFQLDKVQRGEMPNDYKPMPSIGKGVEEIRVWDESGTYRIIYTAKRDIDLAKKRFDELIRTIK
ncbi:MAG: type II toxin-antitoxin system RelE/ParE family toxin [Legionellaceae bacterium]|nr:type II toxin-antitoxin system RelE/ParE family toxin [Legionellaceae bacterium]MBP9775674.1 type II toxin-antitoxin system RelE/ParE family toxin [Legionellaceae bacterium]